jgi:hypothetical protein
MNASAVMKNQDQIPLYAGSPIAYSLKPVTLGKDSYNLIQSSLTKLLKQVEDFSTQVLAKKDKKVYEVLGIPFDLDPTPTPLGLHIPFARFDFVLDEGGKIQVLELNTDGTSSWAEFRYGLSVSNICPQWRWSGRYSFVFERVVVYKRH